MRIVTAEGPREYRAVWFEGGKVRMIDQRVLPHRFEVVDLGTVAQVAGSIRDMTVRGAPAIGATAAYGMALAALSHFNLDRAAALLKSTRPTAHDLFFAVKWMAEQLKEGKDPVEAAEAYADAIIAKCRMIGDHGATLIPAGAKVMTHCNAGALATVDIGTALAPMRQAWRQGKKLFVYVSETRPRLQGMKLTAYELCNEGIPHRIIVDGASGHFMRLGVDLVIVGADRIAANGDFANKIGTYEKAVLAKELGVPFYVAAPISTFDFAIPDGAGIRIEDRAEEEVTEIDGRRIAPEACHAANPAFDMTPARYVTGFITEVGVLMPDQVLRVRGASF
jgi:methylthioribose-1-phosphate isomerase